MFRIATYVCNARSLVRRQIKLCPAIVNKTQNCNRNNQLLEREPCPPPPPPPRPPRDYRLLLAALFAGAATGAFVVYAKDKQEVRDWLTLYLPGFDDFIAAVYQEDMTYGERADVWKDFVLNYSREYIARSKLQKLDKCALDSDTKDVPLPPVTDDGVKKHVVDKDICKLELCVNELAESVMENYMCAKEGCMYYNKVAAAAMARFSTKSMNNIRKAMKDRDRIHKDSMDVIKDGMKKLDDLRSYVECGVDAPKESLEKTKELINNVFSRIQYSRIQYQWECDRAMAFDDQLAKIESLAKQFEGETQVLSPGLDYSSQKPELKGDADLYLYHANRYKKKLNDQIDQATKEMTAKVDRSMSDVEVAALSREPFGSNSDNTAACVVAGKQGLPQCDLKQMMDRELLIQTTYKARKEDLNKEFVDKYANLAKSLDDMIKEALLEQKAKHEAALDSLLKQKEDEVMTKVDHMIEEAVSAQTKVFKQEVAEMTAKVDAVEGKIRANLEAERDSRMSQELWSAAASLLAATKKGEGPIDVRRQLNAIDKAGGGNDEVVNAVLKAIPDTVRTHGVTPEPVLRKRYHTMESVALKVAMVEHDGAPLPIYFLSWLQSVMLFMKLSSIPKAEYEKPPKVPPSDLDTFDLLQRARFWIERGDLSTAWRYVSALEGASRGAADAWLRAAGALLRTRQACDTLLAHAAAKAVKYL